LVFIPQLCIINDFSAGNSRLEKTKDSPNSQQPITQPLHSFTPAILSPFPSGMAATHMLLTLWSLSYLPPSTSSLFKLSKCIPSTPDQKYKAEFNLHLSGYLSEHQSVRKELAKQICKEPGLIASSLHQGNDKLKAAIIQECREKIYGDPQTVSLAKLSNSDALQIAETLAKAILLVKEAKEGASGRLANATRGMDPSQISYITFMYEDEDLGPKVSASGYQDILDSASKPLHKEWSEMEKLFCETSGSRSAGGYMIAIWLALALFLIH